MTRFLAILLGLALTVLIFGCPRACAQKPDPNEEVKALEAGREPKLSAEEDGLLRRLAPHIDKRIKERQEAREKELAQELEHGFEDDGKKGSIILGILAAAIIALIGKAIQLMFLTILWKWLCVHWVYPAVFFGGILLISFVSGRMGGRTAK